MGAASMNVLGTYGHGNGVALLMDPCTFPIHEPPRWPPCRVRTSHCQWTLAIMYGSRAQVQQLHVWIGQLLHNVHKGAELFCPLQLLCACWWAFEPRANVGSDPPAASIGPCLPRSKHQVRTKQCTAVERHLDG